MFVQAIKNSYLNCSVVNLLNKYVVDSLFGGTDQPNTFVKLPTVRYNNSCSFDVHSSKELLYILESKIWQTKSG